MSHHKITCYHVVVVVLMCLSIPTLTNRWKNQHTNTNYPTDSKFKWAETKAKSEEKKNIEKFFSRENKKKNSHNEEPNKLHHVNANEEKKIVTNSLQIHVFLIICVFLFVLLFSIYCFGCCFFYRFLFYCIYSFVSNFAVDWYCETLVWIGKTRPICALYTYARCEYVWFK